MQIAIVGLGRMGANIARRLMRAGHECVVYDVRPQSVAELAKEGAVGAATMKELVAKLTPPRAIWMMLPAAIVDDAIAELTGLLAADDVLIDGGNSYYRHDMARARALRPKGIHYVDVGTSGGVWGLERGFCLMIGGEDAVGEAPRPDLRRACARRRSGGDRRRRRRPTPRRAGLSPLRPERRRPLRQDGPQRHRIRRHGGLCRGLQHSAQRQYRHAPRPRPTPRRRRWRIRDAYAFDLDIARHRRGVAPRQRHRLLAPRSDRRFAASGPGPVRLPGTRFRLRRRTLDHQGGDRRRRARPGPEHGALRALHLARRSRFRRPAACPPCVTNSAATSRRRPANDRAQSTG